MKYPRIGQPVFAIPKNIPGWPGASTDFTKEDSWHPFFNWLRSQPECKANIEDLWKPVKKIVARIFPIKNEIPWAPNVAHYTFVPFGSDVLFDPENETEYIGFLIENGDIEER